MAPEVTQPLVAACTDTNGSELSQSLFHLSSLSSVHEDEFENYKLSTLLPVLSGEPKAEEEWAQLSCAQGFSLPVYQVCL